MAGKRQNRINNNEYKNNTFYGYSYLYCIESGVMILDSLWLYPILGIVGLAILYWFN